MSIASTSRSALGKRPGKQIGLASASGKHGGVESESSRWAAAPVAACRADGKLWSRDTNAEAAEGPLRFAFCCFPMLPRRLHRYRGSKKRSRWTVLSI